LCGGGGVERVAAARGDGLIAAALIAAQGELSIGLVIGLAAAGAMIGDNIGYLIGRKGGTTPPCRSLATQR
jgi:membrane protein DedA with SNARE-associated domain